MVPHVEKMINVLQLDVQININPDLKKNDKLRSEEIAKLMTKWTEIKKKLKLQITRGKETLEEILISDDKRVEFGLDPKCK